MTQEAASEVGRSFHMGPHAKFFVRMKTWDIMRSYL